MSQLTLTPNLIKRAAVEACRVNNLDPYEKITHPYDKAQTLETRPRWMWLQDLCPEIKAVLMIGLVEGISRR